MRKHKDYIPTKKAHFKSWLNGFAKKVKDKGSKFGVTDKEKEQIEKLAKEFNSNVQEESMLQNQLNAKYAETRRIRKDAEKLSRRLAQRIKFSMDYSPADGAGFGIIGAETSFDKNKFKPKIKLYRVSEGVRISFIKGQTEGINIYRRKEGEGDWHFIAHDLYSPYTDTHDMDKHASYEYIAYGVINDQEIGQSSDINKILV